MPFQRDCPREPAARYFVPGLLDDVPFFMTVFLTIAGITVRVDSAIGWNRFRDSAFYNDFLAAGSPRWQCRLKHTIGPPPDLVLERSPFHTQNWQLAAAGDLRVLRIGPAPVRGRADNVVVFDRDYAHGTMYQKSVYELFRRFIDQFLFMNLLSRKGGFLLHASGVVWKGKGICFAGVSGTGKSTLLNLFKDQVARGDLLNDDRLAIKFTGDSWRVYGTPWYGESRVSSPASARLSAIFFIRHSKRNYARRLSSAEICPRMMTLALLPFWDREATSRVLASFQKIIRNIPAFELGFLPGASAVELIKKNV